MEEALRSMSDPSALCAVVPVRQLGRGGRCACGLVSHEGLEAIERLWHPVSFTLVVVFGGSVHLAWE